MLKLAKSTNNIWITNVIQSPQKIKKRIFQKWDSNPRLQRRLRPESSAALGRNINGRELFWSFSKDYQKLQVNLFLKVLH